MGFLPRKRGAAMLDEIKASLEEEAKEIIILRQRPPSRPGSAIPMAHYPPFEWSNFKR